MTIHNQYTGKEGYYNETEKQAAEQLTQTAIDRWNKLNPNNPIGEDSSRIEKLGFFRKYVWDNKPFVSLERDKCSKLRANVIQLNVFERFLRSVLQFFGFKNSTVLPSNVKEVVKKPVSENPQIIDLSNQQVNAKVLRQAILGNPQATTLKLKDEIRYSYDVERKKSYLEDESKYTLLAYCLSNGKLCQGEVNATKAHSQVQFPNTQIYTEENLVLDYSGDKEFSDNELIKLLQNLPEDLKIGTLNIQGCNITKEGVKEALKIGCQRNPPIKIESLKIDPKYEALVGINNNQIEVSQNFRPYQIRVVNGKESFFNNRDYADSNYGKFIDFLRAQDLTKSEYLEFIQKDPNLNVSRNGIYSGSHPFSVNSGTYPSEPSQTLHLALEKKFKFEDLKEILSKSTIDSFKFYREKDANESSIGLLKGDKVRVTQLRALMHLESLVQNPSAVRKFIHDYANEIVLNPTLTPKEYNDKLIEFAPQIILFLKDLENKLPGISLIPDDLKFLKLSDLFEFDTEGYPNKKELDEQKETIRNELENCKKKLAQIETFTTAETLFDINFFDNCPNIKELTLPNAFLTKDQIAYLCWKLPKLEKITMNTILPTKQTYFLSPHSQPNREIVINDEKTIIS